MGVNREFQLQLGLEVEQASQMEADQHHPYSCQQKMELAHLNSAGLISRYICPVLYFKKYQTIEKEQI